MIEYDKKSPSSIEAYAQRLIGKTFQEVIDEDESNISSRKIGEDYGSAEVTEKKRAKGNLGEIIEEHFFHYPCNNDSRPDFEEAGVELKVTPYKINNNGSISAKERLVLSMIDYFEVVNESFETSHMWSKSKLLLLIYYLYLKETPRNLDYKVSYAKLFTSPQEDLYIIKRDFEIIRDKVRAGLAHELSEADTMYLAACPKGATAADRRKQPYSDELAKPSMKGVKAESIIETEGFFAKVFPIVSHEKIVEKEVSKDTVSVSDNFKFDFENSGYMHNGMIYTAKITEKEEQPILLGQILESNVDEKYYIPESKLEQWKYLKGAKKVSRTAANGHEYVFSEGPVAFPDPWDRPGRTMLTSESTLNRSSHVVEDPGTHRLRILTSVETERLQGFDDNWTNSGMTERFRYFCMGNALVVPMVTRMGRELDLILTL